MKENAIEFTSAEAIDPETVYRFIVANVGTNERGCIFSVTFIKKDGALRSGRFRLGVRKGVKGTGRRGWISDTREGVAAHYGILTAYDVDKVVIVESATGRIVATYDATGKRTMMRKNPTTEDVAACDRFERVTGARNVKSARVDIDADYHAERGAHRNIPLDTVLRIRRDGETIGADL